MVDIRPYIDGRAVASAADKFVDVINPSNGEVIYGLPVGHPDDVDRAVAAARMATDDERWANLDPGHRKEILLRWAGLVRGQADQLDALDAEEMGKPVAERLFNAAASAELLQFNAEAADKLRGDVFTSDAASFVTSRGVPHGVVGAIVPWNFPTFNVLLKLGPALVAGNSVVLKPSELASRSALRLVELAHEAGLPSGVLNLVTGLGETAGKVLACHRDVDMLSFTGSSRVGGLMLRYAGESNLKTVLAECGGKSPHLLFADADLDAAIPAIAGFILSNAGQICSVGSRLIVDRSIEAEVAARLVDAIKVHRMGDARDPAITLGPLASSRQRDRVRNYLSVARDGGAYVETGENAQAFPAGSFFDPAIVRGVRPDAAIAQEEVFGPVLVILPFDGEREALQIANGTRYGLNAIVWTRDLARAFRVGRRIRSTVQVNAIAPTGPGAGHAASFEPAGLSGIGREGGIAGIESYMRKQVLWVNHG